MASDETDVRSRNSTGIIIGVLIVLCLAIYAQVLRFDFINFDDNLYVFENPWVIAGPVGDSLRWAFTSFYSANWHPLTWISHMIDAAVFGPYAGGHHFVNVLFHIANSILAFVVFRAMTGDVWRSAVVAILFAVHPAHVESVAWVSERKDVLSAMFWLLTMLSYTRFVRATDESSSIGSRIFSVPYLLIVVFFALGLMSKPMLVTLPFALLLCDYWPLERMTKRRDVLPLVLEKLPLFLLSGISAYITIRAQEAFAAILSSEVLPLDARLLNAAISYAKYIVMLFYPADLGIGYAYKLPLPSWQILASILLLLAVTLVVATEGGRRKYLVFGWLWFLGTMIPVIGLVQVGGQSMADRYTYVPYFGLFVMIVWGVAELLPKIKLNFASRAVAVAIPICILTVMAFNQTSYWRNSETLYAHTLSVGQGNFTTMHNYCSVLAGQKRLAEAEVWCRNAIKADPGFVDAHILLGVIDFQLGKDEDAITYLRRAIELDPNSAMAYGNLTLPLARTGKLDESERSLNTAQQIYKTRGTNPEALANSYSMLGAVFASQKRFDKASELLQKAIELAPDRADFRSNYALALYFQNKLPEARVEAERAIQQNPNQPESYNVLGEILVRLGDRQTAARQFEQALKLRPDYEEARKNLDDANAGK